MFKLGLASQKELRGVHPSLVAVVQRAIELTEQDFTVHDGLRTEAEQREYVKRGVSQTMNSMHRPQADGFGHAVDLVPFINGKARWEWPPIYKIAAAVRKAAIELGVAVRWGGCWKPIHELGASPADLEKAVADYGAARRKAGKKAFTDGPHFELA